MIKIFSWFSKAGVSAQLNAEKDLGDLTDLKNKVESRVKNERFKGLAIFTNVLMSWWIIF